MDQKDKDSLFDAILSDLIDEKVPHKDRPIEMLKRSHNKLNIDISDERIDDLFNDINLWLIKRLNINSFEKNLITGFYLYDGEFWEINVGLNEGFFHDEAQHIKMSEYLKNRLKKNKEDFFEYCIFFHMLSKTFLLELYDHELENESSISFLRAGIQELKSISKSVIKYSSQDRNILNLSLAVESIMKSYICKRENVEWKYVKDKYGHKVFLMAQDYFDDCDTSFIRNVSDRYSEVVSKKEDIFKAYTLAIKIAAMIYDEFISKDFILD
jgi:hypothetical protein